MPMSRIEEALGNIDEQLVVLNQRLAGIDRRAASATLRSNVSIAAVVVAVLVGALGVFVGVMGLRATHDIKASRTESRLAACIQENVVTQHTRETLILGLKAVFRPGVELTEAQQEVVDRYTAQVHASLPFRDCSPDGIKAYLNDPPADPATVPG